VMLSEVSKANVMRFQTPSAWRGRWQLVNSFVPYLLLWGAMVYAHGVVLARAAARDSRRRLSREDFHYFS
jgi:hypothetical protein